MLKLKTVVQQLTAEDYTAIANQFQKNRAEKFQSLLRFFREDGNSEDEISAQLGLNKTAYYTLKSRLYEKIQEFLFVNVKDPRIELLGNVANIHNLIYNTPKDTGIAILKKLEKELKDYDMPNELISVYNALKKLHLYSPKYYEYAQLYNKHVAYTIALDKAEDLLCNFTKTLGEYRISRDPDIIQILVLLKTEMANVFRLYESHHLAIYKNVVNISFALFVPHQDAIKEDESIEEMLAASQKIFEDNPKDADYKFLRTVFDFLAFEYYHSLKLFKNETVYFEKVNSQLDSFLLASHCCINTQFLMSKAERYALLGIGHELAKENAALTNEVSKEDVPNFIHFMVYKAVAFFYEQKYNEAAKTLNELLNEVSFKNMLHSEVEVKLFLALTYSMMNKYEQTDILLKSISRKLNEKDALDYENALDFTKILKLQMSSEVKGVEEKIKKLRDKFVHHNEGKNKILSFIRFDDGFVSELSRSIKRTKA